MGPGQLAALSILRRTAVWLHNLDVPARLGHIRHTDPLAVSWAVCTQTGLLDMRHAVRRRRRPWVWLCSVHLWHTGRRCAAGKSSQVVPWLVRQRIPRVPNAAGRHVFWSLDMQLEKCQAVSIPLYLERKDYLHVLFYYPAPPAIAANPVSDPQSFAAREHWSAVCPAQ